MSPPRERSRHSSRGKNVKGSGSEGGEDFSERQHRRPARDNNLESDNSLSDATSISSSSYGRALGNNSSRFAPSYPQSDTQDTTISGREPSTAPSASNTEKSTHSSQDLVGSSRPPISKGSTLEISENVLALPVLSTSEDDTSTQEDDAFEAMRNSSHPPSPSTSPDEVIAVIADSSYPLPLFDSTRANSKHPKTFKRPSLIGLVHDNSEQQQAQSHIEQMATIQGCLTSKLANYLPVSQPRDREDAVDIATQAAPVKTRKNVVEWIIEILNVILRALKLLAIRGMEVLVLAYVVWILLAGSFSATCDLPAAQRSISTCKFPVISQSEFNSLANIQSELEIVQDHGIKGIKSPSLISMTRSSVLDVAAVVAVGDLPSKNKLLRRFDQLEEGILECGEKLGNLESQIARTIDSVILTNYWTVQILTEILETHEANKVRRLKLMTHFVDAALAPLFGLKMPTEVAVRNRFIEHLSEVEKDIFSLIGVARETVRELRQFDELLTDIKRIAAKDKKTIKNSWIIPTVKIATIFGLDVGPIGKMKVQIADINMLLEQRQQAQDRSDKIQIQLTTLWHNLNDLDKRVRTPDNKIDPEGRQQYSLAKRIETIAQVEQKLEQGKDRRTVEWRRYMNEIYEYVEERSIRSGAPKERMRR